MTVIDDRVRRAARRIVSECANVRRGEHVYIEGRMDAADYLELLAFECERLGATAFVAPRSDALVHRRLLELPPEQLETTSRVQLEAVRAADVVFVVKMEHGDPMLFADVSPEQDAAATRARKPLFDLFFSGTVAGSAPTSRPRGRRRPSGSTTPRSARCSGAASMSTTPSCRAKPTPSAPALEGAHRVHIISPKGTDVSLGIAGRPLDKDVGVVGRETALSNLPAGEVCLAPLEDQTEGTVVFDLAFMDGRRVEDLEVRFEAGRATLVGAAREFEFVQRVVAASGAGADVIGELGIGINPAVGEPCGYTLTDEKILGTVHLALGDNEMLGGANPSTLHWDMMVLGPTVKVDGRPILAAGEWQL